MRNCISNRVSIDLNGVTVDTYYFAWSSINQSGSLDLHSLCRAEEDYAETFSSWPLKQRVRLSYAFLRETLAQHLHVAPKAITLRRDSLGKLYLDESSGQTPAFSLSRSSDGVLVAIAGVGRLGVDIEERGQSGTNFNDLSRAWSSAEVTLLKSISENDLPNAICRGWVIKEAVLKADGRGFGVDPKLVDTARYMARPTNQELRCIIEFAGTAFQVCQFNSGDRFVAVASSDRRSSGLCRSDTRTYVERASAEA